jgi:quinol monooxygenase YgiN
MHPLQWLRIYCLSEILRVVITLYRYRQDRLAPRRARRLSSSGRRRRTGFLAQEAGCIAFDILLPENDESTVVFHEIYRDRAAFEHHLTQPHFHTFERDAGHLMVGKPDITFFDSYSG